MVFTDRSSTSGLKDVQEMKTKLLDDIGRLAEKHPVTVKSFDLHSLNGPIFDFNRLKTAIRNNDPEAIKKEANIHKEILARHPNTSARLRHFQAGIKQHSDYQSFNQQEDISNLKGKIAADCESAISKLDPEKDAGAIKSLNTLKDYATSGFNNSVDLLGHLANISDNEIIAGGQGLLDETKNFEQQNKIDPRRT